MLYFGGITMIHLLIKDLQPGMVAAQSIYDRKGEAILALSLIHI